MPAAELSNPVPVFDITINGRPLSVEARDRITHVLVDDSIAWPSMFAFQLTDDFLSGDEHVWIDRGFAVGSVVEIKLGYGSELERLIAGEITGLEPEFVIDRPPHLIVRGYDRRHRLQKGRKTRTFVGQKDSDIANTIGREANLSITATDSKVRHDYVIQANQTDLEFLRERAERIQYEVVVSNKELFFRPVQNTQSKVLTLTMGDELLEFYPRLSTTRQVTGVTVRGWDPQEKKEIVGTAKARSAQGGTSEVLTMLPTMTQAEADQMAQAALNEIAARFIETEGKVLGNPGIRAGQLTEIAGVGRRFSGQYYVTSAIHDYTAQGGYRTQFQARRNAS